MNYDDEVQLLRRVAALEQRSGQIYDQVYCTYVPLTTALTEIGGGLVGAALNVGTYTISYPGGGGTYTYNYPSTAKALYMYLTADWATAASASFAYVRPNGGTVNEGGVFSVALVANYYNRNTGIVALNSGLAQIVVANANAAHLYLLVQGYFL